MGLHEEDGNAYERRATYLVMLDFYDSFLDKIDFFKGILKETPGVRFILINLPGQEGTQFNPFKGQKRSLNNAFLAECLDLLLFHLNERGIMDCLQDEPYGFIGFGTGANIILHYLSMLQTDYSSTFRHALLFNPFLSHQ